MELHLGLPGIVNDGTVLSDDPVKHSGPGKSTQEIIEFPAGNQNKSPSGLRQAQEMLNEKGYDAGNPDGVIGSHTRAAIRRYQQDSGIPVTGELDRQTLDRLGIRQ